MSDTPTTTPTPAASATPMAPNLTPTPATAPLDPSLSPTPVSVAPVAVPPVPVAVPPIPAVPPPPMVGAQDVRVSIDPVTGVGTLTGTQLWLDGEQRSEPQNTLRPDQIAYGTAEIPAVLEKLMADIGANGGTATPAHLALVVEFVDALRATPAPPQAPAQPTTYDAPNLLSP